MLITRQSILSDIPVKDRIHPAELIDVLRDYAALVRHQKPLRHADPRAVDLWRDWRSLADIAQRAGLAATSGEFMAAVADSQRETLLSGYQASIADVERLVETVPVQNFKNTELPILSSSAEIPELVGEDGDVGLLRMAISETPTTGKLREFLGTFSVTRVVWESIGESLWRSIRQFGQRFALLEMKLLAETIEAAALTPVSGSLDATGLAAGLAKLRTTANDSSQPANLTAISLVCPPALEYAAHVLRTAAGLSFAVAPNPYLSGTGFYLVADPTISPALVRLRLRGNDGPRIGMQFNYQRNPEFFIGLDVSFHYTGAPGLVEVSSA